MNQTTQDYDAEFFDIQSHFSLLSARAAAPIFVRLLSPRSVVDVGSGVGAWSRAFRENGVEAVISIDGDYVDRAKLLVPADSFVPTDLETATDIGRHDLAICLEVAEHLSDDRAEGFVDLLVSAAPRILFSAAIPGQGGVHHINEQWQSYWRQKFEARGLVSVDIRPLIWSEAEIGAIYRQNLMLYCQPDQILDVTSIDRDPRYDIDRIHPDFWADRTREMADLMPRPRTIRDGLSTIALGLRTILQRLGARLSGG